MRLLVLLALLAIPGFATDYQTANLTPTALSATGATTGLRVPWAPRTHTISVTVTGGPATCTVKLEGSIDNVLWTNVSGDVTCTTSIVNIAVDKPVMFIRANLTTLTGGTAPTVSVLWLGVR